MKAHEWVSVQFVHASYMQCDKCGMRADSVRDWNAANKVACDG